MAESTMFVVPQTIGHILCCKCGIPMTPNATNMCAMYLQSEFDITGGLRKQMMIIHCPDCGSYMDPPSSWIRACLESKELLKICIDRIRKEPKSKSVRTIDAGFIWTEPHSKRIKLRQHVAHRRTLIHLEQLILKHKVIANVIEVKQADQGIDFHFANRSHAVKFIEFLRKVAPVRSCNDKSLISEDFKSNKYKYKYTFSVEICPICLDDLMCLPPMVANGFGNLGPQAICVQVSNSFDGSFYMKVFLFEC